MCMRYGDLKMATALITDPILSQPYRVRAVARETPDTFTLSLTPDAGSNDTTFQPGQFSMLWVFGVGELPISISGQPWLRDRLMYTVRSVGQATHALVSQKVGRGIGVRGRSARAGQLKGPEGTMSSWLLAESDWRRCGQ